MNDKRAERERTVEHPMQPVYLDENGHARFKRNQIVRWLLDAGPFDLNKIAVTPFSTEDREQLYQLIGYSVSGFSEISEVRDEVYERAERAVDLMLADKEVEDALQTAKSYVSLPGFTLPKGHALVIDWGAKRVEVVNRSGEEAG